ncbi:MAG TPA: hypothetical protein VFI47_23770 [Acidimicrobiales bacterium]|nr:hypothetical protein [Acidimicrobiales bacterium]
MRKFRRAAVAATAGVVASALMAGVPAGAQEGDPLPQLTVTPTSGPVGTQVTVGGAGCEPEDDEGIPEPDVEFGLMEFDFDTFEAPPKFFAITPASLDGEGDWSGTLVVPEGVDPDKDYWVVAICYPNDPGSDGEQVSDFEFVAFDVTGTPTTPTTPTTPAPATTPGDPTPAAPTAAPATPVVAQPTFTG